MNSLNRNRLHSSRNNNRIILVVMPIFALSLIGTTISAISPFDRMMILSLMLLDNIIKSLREIVRYAHKYKIQVTLEKVPLSNGIHNIDEFKYIIDNVASLFVHLDIPHAFTSGGMKSIIDYINTFKDKLIHIHWHDNHGNRDEHLPIACYS